MLSTFSVFLDRSPVLRLHLCSKDIGSENVVAPGQYTSMVAGTRVGQGGLRSLTQEDGPKAVL